MIPLPPGATRAYEIRIKVRELTDDIGNWFEMVGGRAWGIQDFDWKGRPILNKNVQYGKTKPSYHLKDGTGNVLIRFAGEDASTASMFLIKFYDDVIEHNMQDYLQYD